MHRAPLLTLLKSYKPNGSSERLAKAKMVHFIEQNSLCFERSLEGGHITASSWLVSRDGSRALIAHHRKLDRWLQLGGHCDGDSDVLRVALREAQEESGIMYIEPVSTALFDIDIHSIPAHKGVPEHIHYDVRFLLRVVGNECCTVSSESKELRWVPQDYAALPTDDPSMRRLFAKWLSYSGMPFKSFGYLSR